MGIFVHILSSRISFMAKIILTGKCPFCESSKTGIIITGNYTECIRLKYRYLRRGMLCEIEELSHYFSYVPNNRFCKACGAKWREKDRTTDNVAVNEMRLKNNITDEQLAKLSAHISFQEYMNKRQRTLLGAFFYFLHMLRIRHIEEKKICEKYGLK